MLTAVCSVQWVASPASAACRYRSIWRHSRLFVWQDEVGQPWRDVLRTSARKEFEAARDEKASPELLCCLLCCRGARDWRKPELMMRVVLIPLQSAMAGS